MSKTRLPAQRAIQLYQFSCIGLSADGSERPPTATALTSPKLKDHL